MISNPSGDPDFNTHTRKTKLKGIKDDTQGMLLLHAPVGRAPQL